MKFHSFGFSDIGTSRPNNEDVWISCPDHQFFALADGMGGHKAGEIAASEAIRSLTNSLPFMEDVSTEKMMEFLHEAICKTNFWVHILGRTHKNLHGMGTTLCCLFFHQDRVIYAHVGDSRIYRYRKDHLQMLTEDHSAIREWLAKSAKGLNPSSPQPLKNIITRAIGMEERVQPQIALSQIQKGDLFFLCSDGLSDFVTERKMEEVLIKSPSVEEAVKSFIETAKENGSNDNITVVMVQIEDLHETADLPR